MHGDDRTRCIFWRSFAKYQFSRLSALLILDGQRQAFIIGARAYRSRVDGSVQPYAVTFPFDYAKEKMRKWRVDVVLHGRNDDLTEVAFLRQHDGEHKAAADQEWVQIDIYGRGNNAYRWAGETDMEEAVENFIGVEQLLGRAPLLDHPV